MNSFKQIILTFTTLMFIMPVLAQDKNSRDYYYQIPDYPDSYTATTVAARMIDGLGFRYYWATDGLREQDLAFRPNDQARTSMETLVHIYNLSGVIVHAVKKNRTFMKSRLSIVSRN